LVDTLQYLDNPLKDSDCSSESGFIKSLSQWRIMLISDCSTKKICVYSYHIWIWTKSPQQSYCDHKLTHSLHGAEPTLRSRQLCSCSRTFQYFMETEDSLPCSLWEFLISYLLLIP
jgi:hypothetical protein